MRKDIFSELPNEILSVIGQGTLAKILLNGKDISLSTKHLIHSNKREKVIDYKQLEIVRVIIMYRKSIPLIRLRSESSNSTSHKTSCY